MPLTPTECRRNRLDQCITNMDLVAFTTIACPRVYMVIFPPERIPLVECPLAEAPGLKSPACCLNCRQDANLWVSWLKNTTASITHFFHSTDIYATLHCTLTLKDKYVKVLRLFVETVIEHGLTLLGSTKRGWLWRRLFSVAVNFTKVSTAGAGSLLGFRNVFHCHRELFFPGFPASGRPHNNLCCHSVIQTLCWIKIFLEILPWKTIYSTIPTLTILKKSLHEVTTNVLVVMLAVRSNW